MHEVAHRFEGVGRVRFAAERLPKARLGGVEIALLALGPGELDEPPGGVRLRVVRLAEDGARLRRATDLQQKLTEVGERAHRAGIEAEPLSVGRLGPGKVADEVEGGGEVVAEGRVVGTLGARLTESERRFRPLALVEEEAAERQQGGGVAGPYPERVPQGSHRLPEAPRLPFGDPKPEPSLEAVRVEREGSPLMAGRLRVASGLRVEDAPEDVGGKAPRIEAQGLAAEGRAVVDAALSAYRLGGTHQIGG